MVDYSVIIPQRDRGDDVCRQLDGVAAALAELGGSSEMIVVDDGSASPTLRLLESLTGDFKTLRIIRRHSPGGTSLALSAGMAAARGDVLVALEAGDVYPAEQIPWLVSWLSRADMVVGRRRRQGLAKAWQRVARLPRWMILGLEAHDPDCLFWAARREAVEGIELARGMCRYLPSLVARRGFRICNTYVAYRGKRRRLDDSQPNPGDLLAAWWWCRRWRETEATEVAPTESHEQVPLRKAA